jgi:hypothetical protein
MAGDPFRTPKFLFLRLLSLASGTDPCLPRLLLARLSGARPARPLDGMIGPQDGKPRSPCRNGGGETFFPWAAPIPREPRKHAPAKAGVPPPPSSAAFRPCGCVVDRLRPVDRHRGRGGRGLEQPRRSDMATIGSFKKSGNELGYVSSNCPLCRAIVIDLRHCDDL